MKLLKFFIILFYILLISEILCQPASWPTGSQNDITSTFGSRYASSRANNYDFHYGIDISGSVGTNVYATVSGTVVRVNRNSVETKYVVIKDDIYDEYYQFTHINPRADLVENSTHVTKGVDIIGTIAEYSGGSHLDLKYYWGNWQDINSAVHPLQILSPYSNSPRNIIDPQYGIKHDNFGFYIEIKVVSDANAPDFEKISVDLRGKAKDGFTYNAYEILKGTFIPNNIIDFHGKINCGDLYGNDSDDGIIRNFLDQSVGIHIATQYFDGNSPQILTFKFYLDEEFTTANSPKLLAELKADWITIQDCYEVQEYKTDYYFYGDTPPQTGPITFTPPSGTYTTVNKFVISMQCNIPNWKYIYFNLGTNAFDTPDVTPTCAYYYVQPGSKIILNPGNSYLKAKVSLTGNDLSDGQSAASYNIVQITEVEDGDGVMITSPQAGTELNSNSNSISCNAQFIDGDNSNNHNIGTYNFVVNLFRKDMNNNPNIYYDYLWGAGTPTMSIALNPLERGVFWCRNLEGKVEGEIKVTCVDNNANGYVYQSSISIYVANVPYAICGTIKDDSDIPIQNVTITQSNGTTTYTTTTNESGQYFLSADKNWTGTITTSKEGYHFSPASITISLVTADLTEQNFTGTPPVDLPLSSGWNWICFGRNTDNNALNSIFGTTGYSADDIIKDQLSYAQFLDGTGWVGSLSSVSPTSMYMVKLASPKTITLTGESIDPSINPITLNSGWTWIGYFVDFPSNINIDTLELNSVADDSDKIVSQEGFSTFNGTSWSGAVSTLNPLKGFKYFSTSSSSKSFHWPSTPPTQPLNKKTEIVNYASVLSDYKINPAKYEYGMYLIVDVPKVDGIPDEERTLTAYVNGECRGAANPVLVKSQNKNLYFLTVFSNKSVGEEITFKIYLKNKNKILDISNKIQYQSNKFIGELATPLNLNFDAFGKNGIPTEYSLAQNFPNPFNPTTTIKFSIPESGNVQLIIYNSLGQEVKTLQTGMMDIGNYSIVWDGKDGHGNNVSSGLYLYRVSAGNFSQTRKMILLK